MQKHTLDTNVPKAEKTELTGGIFYSSGVGGAIYNTKASYVYFDSGSLNWNGTEGGGGAVHNAGHFIMTGGEMMYNRALGTNEAYGGAFYNDSSASVFEMAGGTINNNIAYRFYSYGDKSYGGAIYNSGKVYMYGSAVIGDASKVENASYDENNDTAAPSENWGNKAMHGGAICSASKAEVYLGYKPDSNGEAVEEELTGGIYYNYAALNLKYPDDRDGIGGGAIETASGGIVKIASGTIAYNTSEGCGGAVYMSSSYGEVTITGGTIENNIAAVSGGAVYMGSGKSSVLKLSGDAYIPSNDGKNDIFMGGSTDSYYSSISLIGPLSNDFAVRITPGYYSEKVALITAASDSGTTVDAEYKKFTLTQPENGAWAIGENGTLVDKAAHPSNFSVTIQSIESSQPFLISSAGTIITAPEEYLMYTWTILSDTETKTVLSSQSNVFDAAEYFTEGGMYEVLVTAKISEAEGDETSATVSILITSTAN